MTINIYTGGTQCTFNNVTKLNISSKEMRFDYYRSKYDEDKCIAVFNLNNISGYDIQKYEE